MVSRKMEKMLAHFVVFLLLAVAIVFVRSSSQEVTREHQLDIYGRALISEKEKRDSRELLMKNKLEHSRHCQPHFQYSVALNKSAPNYLPIEKLRYKRGIVDFKTRCRHPLFYSHTVKRCVHRYNTSG